MSGNGEPIIRIGRKGRKKIAFGEEGEAFEVDIVGVANAWAEVDRGFRDEHSKIPAERMQELNLAAHAFVKELAKQDDLSLAEALEFLKVITKESEKLRAFFDPKSVDAPASPAPTDLIFST